ncbi:MAG: DUF4105 domain-containing protein [Hyphomonadaceae bacterium]
MPVWNWIRKRPWARAGIAAFAFVVAFFASLSLAKPRLDREWTENLAVMPKVTMDQEGFALDPVMDWTYTADGPATKGSTTFAARFAELKNVWLMVEPQPGQPYAAHTLLLFEFPEDRIVGLTVEARLEKDEIYSAIDGMLNKYELAYMWNTVKELLTRRAVFLNKEIDVYPLTLSQEQKQAFLRSLLDRAVDIQIHPRFYNTFASNCTNELAKAAKLAWHPSWILTGYSPQRLFGLKIIPGATFEAAKEQARMDKEIVSWNDLSSQDFNHALLSELRRRAGATP